MSQEDLVAALGPGQAQALEPGWCGSAAPDGVIERGGHDEYGLPDPEGPRPPSDSRATHSVRPSKVTLPRGTVRQVGRMYRVSSELYWCRVFGLRSAPRRARPCRIHRT